MFPACSATIVGPVAESQRLAEGVGADPALLVDRYDVRVAEAEEPQRQVDRRVPLRADDDPDRAVRPRARTGRRDPTRISTVSRAAARQVKLAIVAPVTKPTALSAGQPEQVEQPAAGDLLDRGARPGVSARSPMFWSQADVSQSAPSAAGSVPADHHAEEASGRDRDQPRLARLRQQVDDLGGRRRSIRQVAEPAHHLVGVDRRRHRPVVQRRQPRLRVSVRPLQCCPRSSMGPSWPSRVVRVDNPAPVRGVTLA